MHSNKFYTGIKTFEWENVHHEIEEVDSNGHFIQGGEARLIKFTLRRFYFLGVPLWRVSLKKEDKGIFSI